MKKVRNILLGIFLGSLGIVVVLGILFETDILPEGILHGHKQAEFILASVMQLLTICCIPLAIRLFRFKKVRTSLQNDGAKALLPWGTLRMCLLCVPMVVNAICYWLFISPGFGYMAIILFLCVFFVFPTLERCVAETARND